MKYAAMKLQADSAVRKLLCSERSHAAQLRMERGKRPTDGGHTGTEKRSTRRSTRYLVQEFPQVSQAREKYHDSLMVDKFFVFNPTLGAEETAEKKVLFYHPSTAPLSEQVNAVGLCEALTNFMRTFNAVEGPNSLHTLHRRHIFFEAEPDVWFVMVARNPNVTPAAPSKGTVAAASAAAASEAMGATAADPAEEELQDCALQTILRRVYAGVRLVCGRLGRIAEERGWEGLKRLLGSVLPPQLHLMAAQGADDGTRIDLLDTFDGMVFLPIERQLYLKAGATLRCHTTPPFLAPIPSPTPP